MRRGSARAAPPVSTRRRTAPGAERIFSAPALPSLPRPLRSRPVSLLCGDELVPAADHVAVLIHHRVPAGDLAHALGEGTAVAHCAGLLHHLAVGRNDVTLGRLALHPEAPLVLAHELLRGFHRRGVVALAIEIGA